MSSSLATLSTPMFRQYTEQKEQHRDAVLFFRVGDFYEMFKSDAVEVSRLLNLTLTHRQGVPMCGVPCHAAENYIAKLLGFGKKVAVCEQIEDARESKGLVKREVIDIYTPGTVIDSAFITSHENNYLASVLNYTGKISFAFLDISTGEFKVTSFPMETSAENLKRELIKTSPSEIIVQDSLLNDERFSFLLEEKFNLESLPDREFEQNAARKLLQEYFGTVNLKAFGFEENDGRVCAASAILSYLKCNGKRSLLHVQTINVYGEEQLLKLDSSTIRNLELLGNLADAGNRYTLFDTLNHTKTAMGARCLRKRILNPWCETEIINKSLVQVEYLIKNQSFLNSQRKYLSSILDIERLASRVAMDRANAKDFVSINNSLKFACKCWEFPEGNFIHSSENIAKLSEVLNALISMLDEALQDNPSINPSEGGIIREGWDSDLDKLRIIGQDGKRLLQVYLDEERAASGIKNLKLKHNRILGYFLEMPASHASQVPPRFRRRQSLANVERFSTAQLDQLAEEIETAEGKIIDLEKELFHKIKEKVKERIKDLFLVSEIVQEIDLVQSFAHCAIEYGYTKPEVNNSSIINIKAGRHPVIECHQPTGSFVPNDIHLEAENTSFALITGPNMAGKSTVLRQVGLIIIMAQMGSFVPAESAEIGIVDQLFCRVGATDNLAKGESTFLVEMNETAYILRNATNSSLVIMDEVGRGTGTSDGLAIAQAVCEYLIENKQPRTLFATHYKELTVINDPRLVNLSLDVYLSGGKISFTRKLIKGKSMDSYGIHVAEMAGIPEGVIKSSKRILQQLEQKEISPIRQDSVPPNQEKWLFTPSELIIDELRNLNTDKLTPLEALKKLASWKEELN